MTTVEATENDHCDPLTDAENPARSIYVRTALRCRELVDAHPDSGVFAALHDLWTDADERARAVIENFATVHAYEIGAPDPCPDPADADAERDHDADAPPERQRYSLYGDLPIERPYTTSRGTTELHTPTRPTDLRIYKRDLPEDVRKHMRPETTWKRSAKRPRRAKSHAVVLETVDEYMQTMPAADDESVPPRPADGTADPYSRDDDTYDGTSITDEDDVPSWTAMPCVWCRYERPRHEVRTISEEDGLCARCAAAGMPGIPRRRNAGPAYLDPCTRRVTAVCQWITEHFPDTADSMITALLRRSTIDDRRGIRRWREHNAQPDAVPLPDDPGQTEDYERRDAIAAKIVDWAARFPRMVDSMAQVWATATPAARAGIAHGIRRLAATDDWGTVNGHLVAAADLDREREQAAAARADRIHARRERDARRDAAPTPATTPSGDPHAPLQCLTCRRHRTTADLADRTDDGLCQCCRSPWRAGLPPLPANHTRADLIRARCAYIVQRHPRPRAALLTEWNAAPTQADKDTITAFVTARAAARPTCPRCQGQLDVHEVTPGGAIRCADCRNEATAPAYARRRAPNLPAAA